MKTTTWISLAAVLMIGCSGSEVGDSDMEELTTPVARGVDTNGSTIGIPFISVAQSQGMGFIGRYLSADGDTLPDGGVADPPLSLEEVQGFHDAGMAIVLLWELHANKRAIQAPSLTAAQNFGAQDGTDAQTAVQAVRAYGQVIYFTVDDDVTDTIWDTKKFQDAQTGQMISVGDIATSYFKGVNSVIGVARTGVYGTYTTVHNLFEAGRVTYGWQITANKHWKDPKESRAQLRQYAYQGTDISAWGVSGPGRLDYDRATNAHYGQWLP